MQEGIDRVNVDLLTHRANDIRNAVSTLNRIGQLSKEQFLTDEMVVDAAKYRMVVAAEGAISICTHLAARLASKTRRFMKHNSYAQCFQILAAAGILTLDLAQSMGNMARFRDLLVHGYADVDDGMVWEFLQVDLADLNTYLSQVNQALGELWQ